MIFGINIFNVPQKTEEGYYDNSLCSDCDDYGSNSCEGCPAAQPLQEYSVQLFNVNITKDNIGEVVMEFNNGQAQTYIEIINLDKDIFDEFIICIIVKGEDISIESFNHPIGTKSICDIPRLDDCERELLLSLI